MSGAQPNGLASLNAQRERARRSMPATRHPVTGKKITAPGSTTTANRPLTGEPAPSPAAAGKTKPRRPGLQSPENGATFKVTLYVDRATDEFMEAARVEGLTSRPKVDVSRQRGCAPRTASAYGRHEPRRSQDASYRPGGTKHRSGSQTPVGPSTHRGRSRPEQSGKSACDAL